MRNTDGNSQRYTEWFQILSNHLTRRLVDGCLSWRIVETWKCKAAYTLASYDLEAVRRFDTRPHLDAIRHIRIIASLLDAIGIPFAIANRNIDRLTIRQYDWNLVKLLII